MLVSPFKMDDIVKSALKTKIFKPTGVKGGGCINQGLAYETDTGEVFVKSNNGSTARLMFDGEYNGLLAIYETNTVVVPKPIAVLDNPKGGGCIVMDYIKMRSCVDQTELGKALACMHLENSERQEEPNYVDKFGFKVPTCCGYIPQKNDWNHDWVTFLTENRLGHQFELLEKESPDAEAQKLWQELKPKIPSFFKGLKIVPALLHGDLWSGNIAEDQESNPVVFDPAAFYGHHEYDLGITKIFGGFSQSFYDAYHSVIPKAPGFSERQDLYKLFHYLNHWNHFGSSYRGNTVTTMRALLNR